MSDFEKRFEKSNEEFMKTLKKIEKKCVALIARYQASHSAIELQLVQLNKDDPDLMQRKSLSEHQKMIEANLETASALHHVLTMQLYALGEIKKQTAFNPNEYYEKFRVTHQQLQGWANKCLARHIIPGCPITRPFKTLMCHILSFVENLPLASVFKQRESDLVFCGNKALEDLAKEVISRLKHRPYPKLN